MEYARLQAFSSPSSAEDLMNSNLPEALSIPLHTDFEEPWNVPCQESSLALKKDVFYTSSVVCPLSNAG